jgi:hypothetical protein
MPMKPAPALKKLSRFSPGKWITGFATTGAAIVSILSFSRSYGLIGEEPAHLAVGSLGVAWVGISPAADTAESIGDTLRFAATVTNKSGSVLMGSWIEWMSDDSTIAMVNPDGTVIAQSPGSTSVVVLVGDFVARSRITVKQKPAGIRFPSDSGVIVPENGKVAVRPDVVDARGNAISGLAPTLRLADTISVTLDSAGFLVPSGPGQTTLEARFDAITATTAVRVHAVPTTITLVGGADQNALAGRPLAAPLTVRVLSMRGKPIGGIPVHFATGDGQGVLTPPLAVTDSAGRVRTAWILGEIPGLHRVIARAEGLDSLLTIYAEADPSAAMVRHTLVGDDQRGMVGDTLAERIGIRITDSIGRALPEIPVTWLAPSGDSIVADAERTDSLGEVRARWRLGSKAGVRRARVQVGRTRAIPPYAMTAAADPAPAQSIALRSGGEQKAAAGSALAQPLVLRVADHFDNGIPGVAVRLEPGSGTVPDSGVTTDSAGRVVVRWTLGPAAGGQKLVAKALGVEKPLEVTATATVGAVAKAAFASPAPSSATVGRLLAPQPALIVTDAHDNPIAGATVTFTVTAGRVTPAAVKTDATGRAVTKWTLGATPGTQRLTAVVKGTPARAQLQVKTVAPAAKAPAATTPAKKKGG